MDKNLLNKEVLCILDTRQIQRFMFRSNSYFDSLGASDLLNHILEDAIKYALENIDSPLSENEYALSISVDDEAIPYFVSDKVKFQLVICAAGNAMCLIRTGALAQKIIRKISRYYLDMGYSLNLSAAAVEKTDNMGHDIFELYKKLNAIKASCEVSNPLGALSVVMRENRTGEPVVAFDEQNGDYVSRSSILRREEAQKRSVLLGISDIKLTKGYDNKEYRAVIHADGNNLGITIGRILQNTPSYEDGIRKRRIINRNIELNYARVTDSAIKETRELYLSKGGNENDFAKEFQLIHRAGDDINVICNANLAFPFLEFFYKNLEGSFLIKNEEYNVPLYVCAGIAFVTADSDYHTAMRLAEECCDSAKTTAKEEENLRDGLAGNWIDFQVCDNPNAQELDRLRQKSYITSENINLLLRPYCLDETDKDKCYSYDNLMKRVEALGRLKLTKKQKEMLLLSYGMGRKNFNSYVYNLKEQGIDLKALLGEPLFVKKGEAARAVWSDAFIIRDFVNRVKGTV